MLTFFLTTSFNLPGLTSAAGKILKERRYHGSLRNSISLNNCCRWNRFHTIYSHECCKISCIHDIDNTRIVIILHVPDCKPGLTINADVRWEQRTTKLDSSQGFSLQFVRHSLILPSHQRQRHFNDKKDLTTITLWCWWRLKWTMHLQIDTHVSLCENTWKLCAARCAQVPIKCWVQILRAFYFMLINSLSCTFL